MVLFSILSGDKVIAGKTVMADSFFSRLTGLLGASSIDEGDGLLLNPCRQIHTYGMKFYIDALFLNKNMEIIGVYEYLPPCRMSRYYRQGHMVLELPAGTVQKHELTTGLMLTKHRL